MKAQSDIGGKEVIAMQAGKRVGNKDEAQMRDKKTTEEDKQSASTAERDKENLKSSKNSKKSDSKKKSRR